MRRHVARLAIAVSAAMTALAPGSLGAQTAAQPLRLEAKILLGNVAGRIDHMAIDLARNRLFVAELGNNSVGIVDLAARGVVRRLTDLKEPQGVAYLRATDTLYVANRRDGSVRMFRGPDYTPVGRIELHSDADNIRLDGVGGRVFVGYGDGALAVIDATNNTTVGSISLKAHPESFQLDPATDDVFVNLPDERGMVVVNRVTGQLRARWPMRHGGNFAMALDNAQGRVLTVFRDPAKLVALSKQTGEVEADADTCGDADDVFVDAKRRRIYISCGDGFIDVRDARDSAYPRLARIATAKGARTSLFVPETGLFLLAVRAQAGEPAAIWVYETASEPGGK
jgi:hypothetical protein